MEHPRTLPRALEPALAQALAVFPVVVVVGPRQVGKSTLVRESSAGEGRLYLTLDELDLLAEARAQPERLLGRGPRVTIDEVQRAPELLLSMKREVDRRRQPGRFLVTGSADVRALRGVADHLPGRAVYLHLEPMSAAELRGKPGSSGWGALLESRSASAAHASMAGRKRNTVDLVDLVVRGGLPPAALLADDAARELWFDGYVRAWLERGLADLAGVADLPDLRRLMRSAAARLGGLLNQAEVARDVGLPRTTAHRHLALLQVGLLLDLLPAYARNRSLRVIKAPKTYWRDVGLAAHLLGLHGRGHIREDKAWGSLLENLILANLRTWCSGRTRLAELFYWRTAAGREVDLVVETDEQVVPVEIKSSPRVTSADLGGIESFLDAHRKLAPFGVVLHTGTAVETPSPRIVAVPVSTVL